MKPQVHSLKEILDILRKKHRTTFDTLEQTRLIGLWPEVVGESIAKYAKAKRVTDQKMYIEVEHPAWKAELTYRKRQVLEKLNVKLEEALGPTEAKRIAIKDLVFY